MTIETWVEASSTINYHALDNALKSANNQVAELRWQMYDYRADRGMAHDWCDTYILKCQSEVYVLYATISGIESTIKSDYPDMVDPGFAIPEHRALSLIDGY